MIDNESEPGSWARHLELMQKPGEFRTVTPMEQIMEMIRKLDERIDDLEYKLRGIMLDD